MQLSQYIGAGNSGVFSLDQLSRCEPFSIEMRAGDLEELSKNADVSRALTNGIFLPKEFCPSEPLEVKWVNWRWPRYEYTTQSSGVKAFIQWVVHNGVVLQQLVLENTGDEPVRFSYTLNIDMLIRDLDYLNPSYPFNGPYSDGPTYEHVSGPNGYGHVCVHQYDSPVSEGKSDDQFAQHSNPRSDREPRSRTQPWKPEIDETMNTQKRDMDRPWSGIAVGAQNGNAAVEDSAKRVQNDTPLDAELHSVAAVTTLFVNGEAVKMSDESIFSRSHTLEGHSFAEFVVAYKLVPLLASGVHWENFLVTAEEADVSKNLRDEINDLWGNSGDVPLCSLGLSMIDLKNTTEETTERRREDSRESEGIDKVKLRTSDDVESSGRKKLKGSMTDEGDGDTRAPV